MFSVSRSGYYTHRGRSTDAAVAPLRLARHAGEVGAVLTQEAVCRDHELSAFAPARPDLVAHLALDRVNQVWVGVPPLGQYTISAQGRVSLVKATASITITASSDSEYYSKTTTATLVVLTTIGRQYYARQTDPRRTDVNPNVDIAANGFIPNESVSFGRRFHTFRFP